MSSGHNQPPLWPESWPPGGHDTALTLLQMRHLADLTRQDIPSLLQDPFLGTRAIVSSFGAESVVLLHYVSRILPGVDVIFLDTGMHFPETLEYRATLAERLDINIVDIHPERALRDEVDPKGTLHLRDPDACCRVRKTFPLQDALAGYDSWISGRKRFQSDTRAALPVLERDGRRIKLNPLAHWSAEEITAYQKRHDLPPHPLQSRGYRSIGCACCTRPVAEGEDPRAGRWPQMPDKVECGIHLGPDGRFHRSKSSGVTE